MDTSSTNQDSQLSPKHYFVDESGDGIIFNKKGQYLPGTEGCPRFFILGLLDVASPEKLSIALNQLREQLLNDPYFKGVPSFDPLQRKTAIAFHAKDDLPEVRKAVFDLLLQHDIRFSAVVRDMQAVYHYVKGRAVANPDYRYHPDELYDYMVRRLFKGRLHKNSSYEVCFSRRGQSNRTKAMASTLISAQERFCQHHGIVAKSAIEVRSAYNQEEGGLQAVDYCLWALQRVYERHEDRYIGLIWPKVSVIHDADDVSEKEWGVYYDEKRPLTSGAVKNKRLRI